MAEAQAALTAWRVYAVHATRGVEVTYGICTYIAEESDREPIIWTGSLKAKNHRPTPFPKDDAGVFALPSSVVTRAGTVRCLSANARGSISL